MSDKMPWEEEYASPEATPSNKMPWEETYSSPEPEAPTSAGTALLHEAGRSVVPGVAGMGGALAMGSLGLAAGPLAPIAVPVLGVAGAFGAGMAARKGQDILANKYAPESFLGTETAEKEEKEHPWATFAGGLLGTGRPSLKAAGGLVKAVGTTAGRQGIKDVAAAMAKKGGVKELQTLSQQATPEGKAAKEALENFGHAIGGTAAIGTQTGMGVAQGEDLGTAALKGAAGMAVKPYVGPGGMFLDPFKASEQQTQTPTTFNKPQKKTAPEPEVPDIVSEEASQKLDETLRSSGASETADALQATKPTTPAVNEKTPEQEPITPSTAGTTPAVSEPIAVEPNVEQTGVLPELQKGQKPVTEAEPAKEEQLPLPLESSPAEPIQQVAPGVTETPAAEQTEKVEAATAPIVEAPQPIDGEKQLVAEDYKQRNRQHVRTAIPQLQAQAVEAEKAGNVDKLNELLLETRIRQQRGNAKTKSDAAKLADSIRQRIARVQNGEAMPAEEPISTEAPIATEEPAVPQKQDLDDLFKLGDDLLGGTTELAAKSPATKAEEDPRAGLKKDLGLSIQGAKLINDGVTDFAAWSDRMRAAFGEEIAPRLKDLWDYSNEYLKNPVKAKEDLGHIENWINDPQALEIRQLRGEDTVVPRFVNMDDPQQFNPAISFEYDPESGQFIVRPSKFDAVIEARKIKPTGQNGNFSQQQIATFINKYLKKTGKNRKTDKGTISTQTNPDPGSVMAENPMPTDRLENALLWYKRNVENRTEADRIYSQTNRLSPSAYLKESTDTYNAIVNSLPPEQKTPFNQILIRLNNALTTRLGGTLERELTQSEEAKKRTQNRKGKVEQEIEREDRLREAREKAIREGKIEEEEPALPSQGKRGEETPFSEEEYGVYENPEGDKNISRLRSFPPLDLYRGYDDDAQYAMRWGAITEFMGRVAQEMRGEKEGFLAKIEDGPAFQKEVNKALRKSKSEIDEIRRRMKTGGTATVSLNAPLGESGTEFQDHFAESGIAPEDSEEVFKPTEDRLPGEVSVETAEAIASRLKDQAVKKIEAADTKLVDKVALLRALVEAKELSAEDVVRLAAQFSDIPERERKALVSQATRIADRFTVDQILDGLHERADIGARSARMATAKTEGEIPMDAHEYIRSTLQDRFPGVEFYADPDMNAGAKPGETAGVMEAHINTADNSFGVRYDVNLLENQIRGMTEEQARKYIEAACDEEVEHIAGVIDETGTFSPEAQDRLTEIGAKLSNEEKLKLARFYLGKNASNDRINFFLKSNFQVGWEYTRMLRQMMRMGHTTEVMREVDRNPSILGALMDYIKNITRWLQAKLRYAPEDATLSGQLDFAEKSYNMLSNKTREISSNPKRWSLFAQAAYKKAVKMGLGESDTGRLFVEKYEKLIDLNKKNLPEQIDSIVNGIVSKTQNKLVISIDDMAAILVKEAYANQDNAGQGGEAARRFLSDSEEAQKLKASQMAKKVSEEREENYSVWKNYLTEGNQEYAKDPYWQAMVHEMLYNALSSDRAYGAGETLPLNPGVLARLREQVALHPKDQNFDLLKAYRKSLADYAIKNAADTVKATENREWIYIPSRSEDPQNFQTNVDNLKSLSHDNWCTKTYNAEPYLKEGGMWILTHGDRPAAAIRIIDGGKIAEIQGKANNGTIPEEYSQDISKLLDARRDQLKNYELFELKNPSTSPERIQKIAKQLVERNPEFDPTKIEEKGMPYLENESEGRELRKILEDELGQDRAGNYKAFADLNNPIIDTFLTQNPNLPSSLRTTLMKRAMTDYPKYGRVTFEILYNLASNFNVQREGFKNESIKTQNYKKIWDYVKNNEDYSSVERMAMAIRIESNIAARQALSLVFPETYAEIKQNLGTKRVAPKTKTSPEDEAWLNELIGMTPATRENEGELRAQSPATKESTAREGDQQYLTEENRAAYAPNQYETGSNPKWDAQMDDLFKKVGTDAAYDSLKKMLSNPNAEYSLAAINRGFIRAEREYQKVVQDLLDKKSTGPLSIAEGLELKKANRLNIEAHNLSVKTLSASGQVLNTGKNIDELSSRDYVDQFLKGTLGGSVEDLTKGKINLQGLMDSITSIKLRAAEATMKAASDLLSKSGITDPEQISQLTQLLSGNEFNRSDLKAFIAQMLPEGAPPETVESLTGNLAGLFNKAVQKIAATDLPKAVFEAYATKGAVKPVEMAKKLEEYIKLGKFDEDNIHQTLLESLGIGGYDADFVKAVREKADEIMKLPENSDQRNVQLTNFQGMIANEIINQQLKAGGVQAAKAAFNILPEIFRSAILTGPPTFLTHGFSGFVNVRLQGAFQTFGQFVESVGKGNSFQESVGYLKDFLDTMLLGDKGARGNPFGREALRALTTGQIGIGLEQGIGKRGADLLKEGVGPKWFQKYAGAMAILPRFMSAFDALNANSARELNQRMAMRAALLNGGIKGKELAERMRTVFAPTQEEMAAAREQLQKEVDSGFFENMGKWDNKFSMANRLEQLHQEISTGKDLMDLLKGERIDKLTKDWTLKGDAKGLAGMVADGIIGTLNRKTKVTQFIFPFVRIISNLMNNSLDYSPLGFAKAKNRTLSNLLLGEDSKYAFGKYVEGSADQYALMAKSAFGTVVATAITAWFLKQLHDEMETGKKPDFMFYGAGPKDYAKRSEWMASGARPNTLKIGDTYIPYKAMPGVDLLGTMLGTLHDYMTFDAPAIKKVHGVIQRPDVYAGDAIWRMALGVAMSPLEHHFLSGAKNLIDVLHDPQGASAPKAVVKQLAGTASQFTNPQIMRFIRNSIATQGTGREVNNLDLTSAAGKAAQFMPFYLGYNQPSLNILGNPITHAATDPLTDRWLFVAQAPPDPILNPLLDHGLFLSGPKKSTEILVNKKGEYKTLNDSGDAAWRQFVIYRGELLKKILTPQLVQRLTQMDRDLAQSILDGPSINHAATAYAKAKVERDVLTGKLKING